LAFAAIKKPQVMKSLPRWLSLLAAVSLLFLKLAAEPRFELEALPAPAIAVPAAGGLVAPWLSAEPADWKALTPQYTDAAKPSGNQIKARVAVTNQKILLHVVVTDDVHFNDRHGGDIWDGDNLQIGIDALGDGAGGAPIDTQVVGPDDIELAAALGADGETLWAHFHGRAGGEGLMPKEYRTIVRDEKTKTTTYDLRIPWSELQAAAGASPVIGVRIQNNDKDAAGGGRTQLSWTNNDNRTRPGLFNRLRLAAPPAELVQFGQPGRYLWRADDRGEIPLYVASERGFEVAVKAGQAAHVFKLPSTADRSVRRYAIHYYPGALPTEPVNLEVAVSDEKNVVVARGQAVLEAPATKIAAVRGRLEQLALSADHPLLARHWRSISELVAVDWARAMALVKSDPGASLQTVGYVDELATLLAKEPGHWADYASGDRLLVFAFASSYDRSLQPYQVRLAGNWNPARTYPLVVDLHGAGNEHPLNYVAGALRPPEPPAVGDVKPAPASEPHITIMPWGRGNRGYIQVSGQDVWDAMGDAAATFQLDPERYYLTGFSMGGGGTWHLGLRTPDRWAAICIDAGGLWYAPAGRGLGGNVSYLPVRIAHGTADGAVPVAAAYAMQAELKQHGVEPNMRIIEGLGHTQPPWLAAENVNWLLQYHRKRPAQFSFVADTDEHSGVWGISMNRDIIVSPLPRFACAVEGNTVRLHTEGTKAVQINPGPDGLRLEGEVVVIWNDKEAYRGPVRTIRLGP
jgi:predicted esterase